MKKVIFTLTLTIISLLSTAQGIEITPMGSYSFIGKMHFYEGELDIKDNAGYGIKIGFSPIEHSVFEFSYKGNITTAEWEPYRSSGIRGREMDLSINYFTIGLHQERMLTSEKVYGFGGLGLGMSYINPMESGIDDLYSMAVTIDLGVKVFLTDRIGIRIQADLQMPIYFAGLGFYAGIGTGGTSGGLSLNSGSYFVQGGFSAGIIFRLGE